MKLPYANQLNGRNLIFTAAINANTTILLLVFVVAHLFCKYRKIE